ncbi:MAG TPA: potassium channel family protein [Acidimicrobiales bacterium]|nr:potassium channel family protein [Acidimicrobiales bacterium]
MTLPAAGSRQHVVDQRSDPGGKERYGAVLLLLLTTFLFLAVGPEGRWVRLVSTVLQGATLLAALWASRTSHRLFRAAAVAVVCGVVAAAASMAVQSSAAEGGAFGLNALLVAGAPVAIVRGELRRRTVDIQTVLAAICVYVLIGMLFAFLFGSINNFGSASFFAQTQHPSTADFQYFSFVTLTTVGYGDLTAAGDLGRTLAVLEALVGQLYLVTVVALLVSNLSQNRVRAP